VSGLEISVPNVSVQAESVNQQSNANRDYPPDGGPNYRKDCGVLCAKD